MIDRAGGVVEFIFHHRLINRGLRLNDLADNPFIGGVFDAPGIKAGIVAAFSHLAIARGVPELGGKIPVALNAVFGQLDVAALRGHCGESKAQRISAVFFGDLQRVHDIAFGFGHFLPLGITDKRMDIHGFERHITIHEMHAHHHHARHPEEDNIEAGDQYIAGIIAIKHLFDVFAVFRPAKR